MLKDKSMLLVQKETHISVEHNRKSRNESTFTWLLIYDKGGQNIHWGKDSPPKQPVYGGRETGALCAKESNWNTL